MQKKKINVGGVALFNGIMFTSEYRQACVQNKGRICGTVVEYAKEKNIIQKIPILRGIVGLTCQLNNATPTFLESTDEEEVSKYQTVITYAFLIVFCISLAMVLSIPFDGIARNIIQGITIIFEFIIYLVLLKNIKQLDRVFMYHGAEHKAVNAYENLEIEEITLENVKKQSRFHKRCGGNLIMYFIVLMVASCFLPISNLFFKALALIGMGVLNVGISYEIVTLIAKLKPPFDIIGSFATLIQFVTVKEPTDDMLKLAIYGILSSVREKSGITPEEYVKKYVSENLNGVEYDTHDIYSILEFVTGENINTLLLKKDSYLIRLNMEIKADTLLNRYFSKKIPLQYLTNKQYFFKEVYYVDENVLIPRADTEILVEKAIEYINNEKITTMIDLCTGSGAIGISTAKNSDIEKVELIDISVGAINVAKRNVIKNNVEDKIKITISDLLDQKIKEIENPEVEDKESLKVGMIVSNPPYIRTDVIASLQEEVKKEPHIALDGGKSGLDFYIRIIEQAKKVLLNNGLLLFEIGYDQLDQIKELISNNKEFELLESVKDYGGNDRVVVCRFQQM